MENYKCILFAKLSFIFIDGRYRYIYLRFRQRNRKPKVAALLDPLHDRHQLRPTDPIDYKRVRQVCVMVSVI